MGTKQKKTVIRTVRVTKELNEILVKDANLKGTNLNAFISSILTKYAEWGRFIDKIGVFTLSRATFGRLLDASSDEAIIEAARLTDTPKAVMLAKHGALSLRAILDFIRAAAAYGGYAEYNEVEEQGKLVITIMHNLGRKGSLYLSNILESMFANIDCHPKISSSEHSILIEI